MNEDIRKEISEAVSKAITDLNTINSGKNSNAVPTAVLVLALLEKIIDERLGTSHIEAFLNIKDGLPFINQTLCLKKEDMVLLLDDVFQKKNVSREFMEAINYLSFSDNQNTDKPICIDFRKYDGELLFNAIIRAMGLPDSLFSSSSVSELAASILDVKEDERFLDFTSGIGLSTACITRGRDNVDINLIEQSVLYATLSECMGFLCNKKNIHVEEGDGFLSTNEKYDKIFVDPPLKTRMEDSVMHYGIETDDATLLAVLKASDSLSEKGRSIVMVPGSFLFGIQGSYYKVRKHLIGKHILKGVILLPSMWKSTTIKTALLVFEENSWDIAMINISSDEDVRRFTTYDKTDRSRHLTKEAISYITDRINGKFRADDNSVSVTITTMDENDCIFEPSLYIKKKEKGNRELSEINAEIASTLKDMDVLLNKLQLKNK